MRLNGWFKFREAEEQPTHLIVEVDSWKENNKVV
jgi:hypothetical protein